MSLEIEQAPSEKRDDITIRRLGECPASERDKVRKKLEQADQRRWPTVDFEDADMEVAPINESVFLDCLNQMGFDQIARVGQGGMGVVYKARNIKLEIVEALKFNYRVCNIKGEAKAMARFDSPYVASVYDTMDIEGTPIIRMQLIDGEPLAKKVNGALDAKAAVTYLIGIAKGIQAIHEAGFIHRDLKPSNVMVNNENQPVIIDFGLAQVPLGETEDAIVGTAPYMSPEHARGEGMCKQSDIYGLGVILFELLTGKPPFHGENLLSVIQKVQNEDPDYPDELHPDLRAICETCMAKDWKGRYQDTSALIRDLVQFQKGCPVSVRNPGVYGHVKYWIGRQLQPENRVRTFVISVLSFVVLTVLVIGKRELVLSIENRFYDLLSKTRLDRKDVEQALTLTVESTKLIDEKPVRSLRLAIEAVEATTKYGKPVVAKAEESLRRSMSQVDGIGLTGRPIGTVGRNVLLAAYRLPTRYFAPGDLKFESVNLTTGRTTSVDLHLSGVRDFTLCGNGHWLVAAQNNQFRVWRIKNNDGQITTNRQTVADSGSQVITQIVASSNGNWLAVQGRGENSTNTVDLWRVDSSLQRVHRLTFPEETKCVFSPKGNWLVTCPVNTAFLNSRSLDRNSPRNPEHSTGAIWHLKQEGVHKWATADIRGRDPVAVFCSDEEWVALSGDHESIQVHSLTDEATMIALKSKEDSRCEPIGFSIGSRWLITSDLKFWELDTLPTTEPTTVDALKQFKALKGDVGTPILDKNGQWLVAGGGQKIWIWNLSSEQPWQSPIAVEANRCAPIRFIRNGTLLIAGDHGEKGRLRVFPMHRFSHWEWKDLMKYHPNELAHILRVAKFRCHVHT
ncbi:MAG: serine/threonine protein kinase [Planctomycetales bacterium]|nr:serine/threonine protein kinase [Planctomycetales bacterium]